MAFLASVFGWLRDQGLNCTFNKNRALKHNTIYNVDFSSLYQLLVTINKILRYAV